MSILGDLKLAYETLADDPIEVSLYYGHSILSVLPQSVTPKQPAYAVIPNYFARDVPIAQRVYRIATPLPEPVSRELPTQSRGRDYSNFISRSPASRSTNAYSPRNLIGAL